MNENDLTLDQVKDKLKELTPEGKDLLDAEGVFLIVKDTDGNYRGFTSKNGQFIQCREVGPESALQVLLTHPGN